MNTAIDLVIQLMRVEPLSFTVNFVIKMGHTEDRCRMINNSRKAVQVNQCSDRGYRSSANKADASQLNIEEQSPNFIPNFSFEPLQQIASLICTQLLFFW